MQKVRPTVSVIVPIYKVEKYLQKCIDSICGQTYPQLEIILVEDGSPDNCGNICWKNASCDSRIIVVHKENGGLSSARNAGLDIATGKYVAFIDSDDTVHPLFIENLVGLCERYGCDLAQCDFLSVTEDSIKLPVNSKHPLRFYEGGQALDRLCRSGEAVKYTVAWNKLYERRLFEGIRYPKGRIHEDEFITWRLFWKARKVVVTNQYLYYYLQRQTSIMGRPFNLKRLDGLEAFKERLFFLGQHGLFEAYASTLRKYFYLLETDYELLLENVESCEEICKRLLEEKEKIEKQVSFLAEKKKEDVALPEQMMDACLFPKGARIMLYGAGNWGRIYYRLIEERRWGTVVGWVDNLWYTAKQTDIPIQPLDYLVRVSYDYVLIAIKSKSVQEEVKNNLIGWGIEEEKILTIRMEGHNNKYFR